MAGWRERYGLHDLDFRFEVNGDDDRFLFAHHGLNLSDLADTVDLSSLGYRFYLVEMRQPFTLEAVIQDSSLFQQRYGTVPDVVWDRCLRFDVEGLTHFFRQTRDDDRLECGVVSTLHGEASRAELEGFLQNLSDRERRTPLGALWPGSLLHTHDNHFFWLEGRPVDRLRRLIAETILARIMHDVPESRKE